MSKALIVDDSKTSRILLGRIFKEFGYILREKLELVGILPVAST